jgi:hypothetical protein
MPSYAVVVSPSGLQSNSVGDEAASLELGLVRLLADAT